LVAAIGGLSVLTTWDCPLGMEFERTDSRVVEQRLVPPRVVCRYEYLSGPGGSELYPTETKEFDATTLWLAALGTAAVATVGFVWATSKHEDGRVDSLPGVPRSERPRPPARGDAR
jgi:hypothetical protein